MALKNINKDKSKLIVIATAELYGEVEDQNSFKYDSSSSVKKIPGGIGYPGAKYVSTVYEGVDGTIETNGAKDGHNMLLAYAQHVDPKKYVGFHLSNCKPIFFVGKGFDDNCDLVRSYFVENALITKEPVQLEEGNISFSFTAPQGMEMVKDIKIEQFDGEDTPITALTLETTAIADPLDRNVMLVLKDTASRKGIVLKEGKDYTATTTAVTLKEGLEKGEKALVVYLDGSEIKA